MVPCKIRPMDIEAMDYWLNEAPMSDPPSQNAIVFALKRMLLPGTSARIVIDAFGNTLVMLDGKLQPLTPALAEWYHAALAGHPVEPLTDWIPLPWDLLSRRIQAELRDVRNVHPQERNTDEDYEEAQGVAS